MKKKDKRAFFQELTAKSNMHSVDAAKKVYYGLISTIMDELRAEEEIELPDWGEYYIKKYPPRNIRDVNTGQIKQIDAKKVVKFTPCRKLKDYAKDMDTRLDNID